MSVTETSFYVTGGTLHHDTPSYVERRADTDLYQSLQRGEFCYVLTSRQMGKSSLMNRTAMRLREAGIAVARLDLQAVGQNVTAEQWYLGLLNRLGLQLDLEDELEAFWEEHEQLGPLQRWVEAIRVVALPNLGIGSRVLGIGTDPAAASSGPPTPNTQHPTPRLVIFLDEIDMVRGLPFSTDEFFAAIRECYNRRTQEPEFHRLTFCLLGVASPSDLIRDTRLTPFNIGRRIELTDFTEQESARLRAGLVLGSVEMSGREEKEARALLERVLYWTGGHPYLTQRLCRSVAEDAEARSPASVDRHCSALFFSSAAQERDDNLIFVRERLLRSEADQAALLDLYAQVRRGKRVPVDDTNQLVSLLRLSGITRVEEARRFTPSPLHPLTPSAAVLRVRNRIYERVFDRNWVSQHMPDAELRRQRAAFRRGLLRAASIAALIVAAMGFLTSRAVRSERRANRAELHERKQRLATQRLLYDADMNVAQQTWATGNAGRMVELLQAHRPQPGEEDLRGFEWFYLWRLGHGDRLTLRWRPGAVGPVTFSPDGTMLAMGNYGSGVHLRDASTGRELRFLEDHHDRRMRYGIRFSPDGKALTTVSGDGTVRFWDLRAARVPRTTTFEIVSGQGPHGAPVDLSPDAKVLAIQDKPNIIALHDLTTGRAPRIFPTGPVDNVTFSPDGKTLAAGSSGDAISLWDVQTGRKTRVFAGPPTGSPNWLRCLAFSPDGRRLAAGNFYGALRIWDVPAGTELHEFQAHRVTIWSLAFSPDGRLLATASRDGTAKLWDVESGHALRTFRGHRDQVMTVAFSPDGRRLATSSGDGTVKVWDVVGTQHQSALPWQRERAEFLAFAPIGRMLATGGGGGPGSNGPVRLWDVPAGSGAPTLKGQVEGIGPLAFSLDGKTLATVRQRTVRLWDLATARETRTLTAHTGDILTLAFSPARRTLAAASQDGVVRLWDIATGRQIWARGKLLDGASAAAFSPDGRTLAVAGGSGARVGRRASFSSWTAPRGGWCSPLSRGTPPTSRRSHSPRMASFWQPGVGTRRPRSGTRRRDSASAPSRTPSS